MPRTNDAMLGSTLWSDWNRFCAETGTPVVPLTIAGISQRDMSVQIWALPVLADSEQTRIQFEQFKSWAERNSDFQVRSWGSVFLIGTDFHGEWFPFAARWKTGIYALLKSDPVYVRAHSAKH